MTWKNQMVDMYVTSPEHMVIANDNYLLTLYNGTEQQVHLVLQRTD